ncbi:MAG TPA: radical SAM/SPASM domain-containing protein [Candidatus Nanoarchaeia archaeon]|nr:radical SAM/SPASM domain-containing protein [Candidatus Nanoarchaeia archaeon]
MANLLRPKYFKQAYNEFKGDYGYHHQKVVLENKPNIHCIELTNACNLRCTMCFMDIMKRKKNFMKFSVFKKIIDENHKNMNLVYLQAFGESTLHKELPEFIRYAKSKNVRTGLHTNGTLLTKELSNAMMDSGLYSIRFSIDGITEEKYNKIRIGGDFERLQQNIKDFVEIKNAHHYTTRIAVQIIHMNETKDDIAAFKKEWDREGIDEVIVRKHINWRRQWDYQRTVPCLYVWKSVVILWNGDVALCCNDWDGDLILGNMEHQTLEEVWNGPRYQMVREKMIKGQIDFKPCKGCNVLDHVRQYKTYPFSSAIFEQSKKVLNSLA